MTDFTKLYKIGDKVVVNNHTIPMKDAIATVIRVTSNNVYVKYDVINPLTGSWHDNWHTPHYISLHWISKTKLFKALK